MRLFVRRRRSYLCEFSTKVDRHLLQSRQTKLVQARVAQDHTFDSTHRPKSFARLALLVRGYELPKLLQIQSHIPGGANVPVIMIKP